MGSSLELIKVLWFFFLSFSADQKLVELQACKTGLGCLKTG